MQCGWAGSVADVHPDPVGREHPGVLIIEAIVAQRQRGGLEAVERGAGLSVLTA